MAPAWANEANVLEFETELYSGPLDLLLDLIQRAELDITKLSIAKVTDQFLAYVQANQDANPDYISEFLILATKLVQIKSETLLPRPVIRLEEEEDPGEALARQLLLYREIKNATSWLNSRLAQNLRSYLHLPPRYPMNVSFDLSGLEAQDLVLALEALMSREAPIQPGSLISIPRHTLQRKVQELISSLRSQSRVSFRTMLGEKPSRLDTVVLFLAILELVKQHVVHTSQDGNFGDIVVEPTEEAELSMAAEIQIQDE